MVVPKPRRLAECMWYIIGHGFAYKFRHRREELKDETFPKDKTGKGYYDAIGFVSGTRWEKPYLIIRKLQKQYDPLHK